MLTMITYAIILLDKTAIAFCHADNPFNDTELIPLDTLKAAIHWCMKENLRIQFVYPDYKLPNAYLPIIDSIDHADIKHLRNADVTVCNGWDEFKICNSPTYSIVIRLSKTELLENKEAMLTALAHNGHIAVVITDIESFTSEDMEAYQQLLSDMALTSKELTINGSMPQISILTDRLMLSSMNNCNAGAESITIAPNGKFYICPAFYYDNEADSVGSVTDGLIIRNSQLYKLDNAPICRECDAWHCRRCVWLNRKTTREVNTPSHEQCMVSHIERNSTCNFIANMRKHGEFLPGIEIAELDYIDPFDKIINTK